RMTRAAVLDVLREDYVRTARAKGVGEIWVLGRHALRNAFIPILTLLGLQSGQLMGGAVLTETVFAWPGLGRLMVKAIFARDYVLLQGAVLVFALAFVVINLLVDLSYGLLDPRVGRQGGQSSPCARADRRAVVRAAAEGEASLRESPCGAAPTANPMTAWTRFRRNRLALVGLALVTVLALSAVLAPWLAPLDP